MLREWGCSLRRAGALSRCSIRGLRHPPPPLAGRRHQEHQADEPRDGDERDDVRVHVVEMESAAAHTRWLSLENHAFHAFGAGSPGDVPQILSA